MKNQGRFASYKIHTEWLDHNGYPLPAGLKGYGYTGRLTKQIDHAQGDNGSDIMDSQATEFSIDPGRQMQVLRFDKQQPYDHFVQVNGYPSSEQNDFSSGDHTGLLKHRPSRYVPVKVPLYNEQGTVNDRLALIQDENQTSPKQVNTRFHWVYRPELSFGVIDIAVNDILLKDTDEQGNVQELKLLDSTHPVISSSDDLVEVLFKLIGSEYDRITPMEGEQQYIFALGEQEIEVNINKAEGEQQQITFSNLDYLSELNAVDYLTLSLYLNKDSQNLLWNWAFTTLDVDLDEDNNNGTDLPDRTVLEEQIESISAHGGKRNFLNTGDVNNNGIPDFAEFEYIINPEQNTPPNQLVEHHFVPIVVEIPEHVDLTDIKSEITFYYEGSDPLAVKIEEQIYTPAVGTMRLWVKDADVKRNPNGFGTGGDYLEPNQAYKLTDLLKDSKKPREFVLYAEAIRATENRGAALTTVLNYTHRANGKENKKEERSINGLTNLEKPFQAVAALPQDTALDLAYSVNLEATPPTPQITLYSIGGVRLKLTYNLNSLTKEDRERLDKITWTFNQKGRLCEDLKIIKDNKKSNGEAQCTDMNSTADGPAFTAEHSTQGDKNEDHTIYWEPEEWSNNLNTLLTTKTHYKTGQDTMTTYKNGQEVTVDYPKITQSLAIKTRALGPKGLGQEYRGNDVKMLEQMLWQLGLSADNKIFGLDGNKTAKIGINALRLDEDKRSVFYTGITENTIGNMLSRFNYFSHSPIATSKALDNPTYMDDKGFKTLIDLKRHWYHYMQAYQTYSSNSTYTLSEIVDGTVLESVTAIFEGKEAGITETYGKVHEQIKAQYEVFEPSAIVQAIAATETSSYHWGYGNSSSQKHRMVVGGADEAGSKGFNQIQNKFAYGGKSQSRGNSNGCIEVSAYDANGNSLMNHYDPIENLKGIAIWLAKSNCGGSFSYAFEKDKYTGTYKNSTYPIRAFKIGSEITEVTQATYTDGGYELLMKGIGGYNRGLNEFVETKSWPELLTTETKNKGKGAGVCYAFKVVYGCNNSCNKCKAKGDYLPFEYRQYIWKGGTYDADLTDDQGNPDPKAGQDWCFGYGEEEWLAGKTFDDVSKLAIGSLDIPAVGRINCTTGENI